MNNELMTWHLSHRCGVLTDVVMNGKAQSYKNAKDIYLHMGRNHCFFPNETSLLVNFVRLALPDGLACQMFNVWKDSAPSGLSREIHKRIPRQKRIVGWRQQSYSTPVDPNFNVNFAPPPLVIVLLARGMTVRGQFKARSILQEVNTCSHEQLNLLKPWRSFDY